MTPVDSKQLRAELLATGAITPGASYVPPAPAPRRAGVLRLDDDGRAAAEVRRHDRAEAPDFSANGRVYVLSHRGEPRLRRPRAF